MPNYLTKEEIRQWRGSLEKITLEEFAARLGKSVEESKPTNDVIDIVMSKGTSSSSNTTVNDSFSTIAERAFKRERQISHTPFSINKKELQSEKAPTQNKAIPAQEEALKDIVNKTLEKAPVKSSKKESSVLENVEELSGNTQEINIVLKKSLTDREQLVFEYFLNNVGKTVFAKDLAELLELPRDYVYKYIKNLRAKIEGDKLRNVPSGGFILAEN